MIAEVFTSRHWIDLISHDLYPPSAHSLLLAPPSSPLALSCHSALHEALSCFPVTLDVIAKTTSPWQQLVTSSSPTLSFDGCFYFGGLVDVARTSLVERITCSGGEGTMLPSVGSKCLHTANGGSCDDSPQSITWQRGRLILVPQVWNKHALTEAPLWKGRGTMGRLPLKAAGMEKRTCTHINTYV